ncbi:helix-turn-helix domain-containing protein [Lapidilactobacillus wuchangensis]|uniref:helix-turn-helix domain-containing protein n=1 Tax=Lapidilactobacillus wuchangensis TaxID=2486001 RepID=UPI000F790786|nr:Rgg/GadR/MutR family transcriptional regulator [Lapidilactobacillus wuchangensis]
MNSYGELVRTLRIDKEIRLKDLYANIMSKSYAISFEKGEHEISFYLLSQILKRLPMAIDEFLFLYQGEPHSLTDWFYQEYGHYANNDDIAGLKQLRQSYQQKDPDSPFLAIRLAEIDARIDQLNYFNQHGVLTNTCINATSLTIIKNYLATIQTWTINNLRFLANTLDYIDYQEKVTYFQLLLPALDKYKDFEPGREVICTLLINAIHQSVMSLEFYGVNVLLAKLASFSEPISAMYYKNAQQFYTGLKLIYQQQIKAGTKLVNQAIATLQQLHYPHQAALYQSAYQEFLEKIQINLA